MSRVSIRRADLGLSERRSSFFRATSRTVSIRRADLGLSEPSLPLEHGLKPGKFQSAGRIWGFRNRLMPVSTLRVSFVSIRRADLGLSEPPHPPEGSGGTRPVSIRRADLGLSEQTAQTGRHQRRASFNPPGGFGAFGTKFPDLTRRHAYSFNPPGGFGAFGTKFIAAFEGVNLRFNPPGGFGAFGTSMRQRCVVVYEVSIRRADLGLSEL
ncbi:hypothetical protein OSCT_0305 [Oscillochloris trichoides DG-6]|uniref:Uncharacterized protein n=1 Tax=Oscillochloris trichoides DG-6 TaxID=765420 RepID=E1IAF4_9CHLR|nr:hypothetical protein OSCT_0305 [Oscillochloris trichoides DG-6]